MGESTLLERYRIHHANMMEMTERIQLLAPLSEHPIMLEEMRRLEENAPKHGLFPDLSVLIKKMPPVLARIVHFVLRNNMHDFMVLKNELGAFGLRVSNRSVSEIIDHDPNFDFDELKLEIKNLDDSVPSPWDWGRYWNTRLKFNLDENDSITIRVQDSPDGITVFRCMKTPVEGSPLEREFEAYHALRRQSRESCRKKVDELISNMERGHLESVERSEDMLELFRGLLAGDLNSVRRSISRGIDPTWRVFKHGTIYFLPILHAAVDGGNSECLNAVLPYCDPDMIDSDGKTALHNATIIHRTDMMAMLAPISTPDLPDFDSKTPMVYASKESLLGVELLMKHGASQHGYLFPLFQRDVPWVSPLPWLTPLALAAQAGNLAICEKLISKGADPLIKDDEGRLVCLDRSRVPRETLEYLECVVRAMEERHDLSSVVDSGKEGARKRI